MTILAVTPMFFGFLAPLLGGGLAALIGQAVVGLGISLGLGYLARRLQPQPDTSVRGMSLSLQMDSNDDRQVAFGRCASAGSLKYHNTYGPNGNDYLQLVYQLADHECDALEAVIVNGERKDILADASTALATGNAVEDYAGAMWVKFYSGAWSQSADADLVARAPSGGWDANDRGRGVCYVRVTLRADANLFKTGLPEFVWVFRGAKLYDPRKDAAAGGVGSHDWANESTREWSDNLALCAYNYLRGIRVNGALLAGVNAPRASLSDADWMTEAALCDETVGLKAGGTEKRYRMGGVIDCGTEPRAVIREMLAACGGDLIDSGGIFRLRVAAARAPVMTVTDADIEVQGEVEISPKLSRSQLVNTVYGSFTDPAQGYESTSLPPRVSLADQAADGGIELAEHYNLPFVSSGTQGQRVTEIMRRKGRFQRRISLPLRARFAVLEAGDWVTFTSDRYGISGGQFEVHQSQLTRHLSAQCEWAETSESIFDWVPADDELDPAAPKTVAAGGSTFTTVAGFALASAEIQGTDPGVFTPVLVATWTPITDGTVVGLEIQFRRVGDTVAQTVQAVNPEAGSFTWAYGVLGETDYEARARPITSPPRSVSWTGWAASPTTTTPPSGGLPSEIPPELITELPVDIVKAINIDKEDFVTIEISGPGDVYRLNFATGRWYRTDGTMFIDLGTGDMQLG